MTDPSDAAAAPPARSEADAAPSPGTAAAPSPQEATPPSRVTWVGLAQPFGAGFALTLGGLIAFALGVAFSNLSTIIIYVSFALFAALGLDPVVRMLERRNVPRTWGIVTVFTGFAVVLVGVLWLIIPTVVRQVAQFIADIPGMITDFQNSDVYNWLTANLGDVAVTIVDQLKTFISDPGNIATIGGGVIQFGVSVGTTISGIIIVLVLSLYFLASLPVMKVSFARLAPARSRPTVTSMTEQIATSIGGYLGGMVVLAFFNSILAFLLYLVLGLPFPLLMAVTAFCITLIPLVGSVLFWAIGTVVALFSNPLAALIFAVVYLIYMQLEAYVLTPRVMNKTISVPGALVVIGALVGGTLLGLLGALVAIPVTASILLIIKQIVIPRQDAKL